MVLNFHGLDGKPDNTIYRLLREVYFKDQIYSPRLYYTWESIGHLLDRVYDEIQGFNKIDFIVGNSMGGFVALYFAYIYQVPFILVNPCLRPDESLKSIEPEYAEKNKEEFLEILETVRLEPEIFKKAHVIFGDNDEVIDSSLAKEVLGSDADIKILSGGHQLSGDEFEKEFKKMVMRIV